MLQVSGQGIGNEDRSRGPRREPSLPDVSNLDAVMLLDTRIALARARRAAAERFSDAFWEADDELVWLRMVREEAARTGHVPGELMTLLASAPVAVEMAVGDDVSSTFGASRVFDGSRREVARHAVAARDEGPATRHEVEDQVSDALFATRVA